MSMLNVYKNGSEKRMKEWGVQHQREREGNEEFSQIFTSFSYFLEQTDFFCRLCEYLGYTHVVSDMLWTCLWGKGAITQFTRYFLVSLRSICVLLPVPPFSFSTSTYLFSTFYFFAFSAPLNFNVSRFSMCLSMYVAPIQWWHTLRSVTVDDAVTLIRRVILVIALCTFVFVSFL